MGTAALSDLGLPNETSLFALKTSNAWGTYSLEISVIPFIIPLHTSSTRAMVVLYPSLSI